MLRRHLAGEAGVWRALAPWALLLIAAGPSTVTAFAAEPQFTPVTAQLGLAHEYASLGNYGPGVAAVDYDGDGDFDLFVSNDATGNKLYRNEGTGVLVDVAPELGLDFVAQLPPMEDRTYPIDIDACSMMPNFLDLDGDGDRDFFLTTWNSYNRYFENVGGAVFVDRTEQSGLGTVGHAATAAFCDYDGDGLLDVYIADWGGLDRLYRNAGESRFSDSSERGGIWDNGPLPSEAPGWCAIWYDHNDDGLFDLYVGNDYGIPNKLFLNRGGGRFEDEHDELVHDFQRNATMGQALGDFDLDGDYDLFVANSRLNNFYERIGDHYEDRTTKPEDRGDVGVLKDNNIGWFCDWPDIDNDGWVDLFLVNGHITLCEPDNPDCPDLGGEIQPNRLWMNNGDRSFRDASASSGLDDGSWGRSAAIADFDLDGDLDIYVANNDGEHTLYRNDTESPGSWLTLRLKGTVGNTEGIGARVVARVGARSYMRDRWASTGYLSQHSDEIHLGLGDAEVIDELTVIWPSGVVDRWLEVPTNQRLMLSEGASAAGRASARLARIDTVAAEGTTGSVRLDWSVDPSLPWDSFAICRVSEWGFAGHLDDVGAKDGWTDYTFYDRRAVAGEVHRYLVLGSYDGVEVGSVSVEAMALPGVAALDDEIAPNRGSLNAPSENPPGRPALLSPAFPNPFNGHTTFSLGIADASTARFRIIDALGRVVAELPVTAGAGGFEAVWDGTDGPGRPVASGVYRGIVEATEGVASASVSYVK